MEWLKKGRIFDPKDNYSDWITSYAAVPVADLINDDCLRIYFSTRDEKGRSQVTFIDVRPDRPESIEYVHSEPVLPLGELGTFDDSGIMPSWIVNDGNRKLLYYIGWNPQVTVSYRLSIGLAQSVDGGRTFQKVSAGPICDRGTDEPFFNTGPCVIKDGGEWKMWYVSCSGWAVINGRPEPSYNIKYALSSDGITWSRSGKVCIDYGGQTEAIGRPCVFIENGLYKMIYSHRRLTNYRSDPLSSYKLGYAESVDGIAWTRKDNKIGIAVSPDGWDSMMQEYATTYSFKGSRYLIYNGNGFGQTGFGYAVQMLT